MNAIFARAGLAALALGIAVPAHAGVSEDFSECDGLKKPKSSDDGVRGEATFPSYRFGGRDAPSQTLAACNRVLESGKLLPEQTLRRAHVLRGEPEPEGTAVDDYLLAGQTQVHHVLLSLFCKEVIAVTRYGTSTKM
ncbi:hypothetical protein ACIPPQ_15875 [Sphingopyxis sp. LARHCG72]